MGADHERAIKYRERAKQLRMIELDVRSPDDRKTLRAIAKEFEQMATEAKSSV
jgi:hypothetical protein